LKPLPFAEVANVSFRIKQFLSVFPKADDSLHGLPAPCLRINLFKSFFDDSVHTLGFLAQMLQESRAWQRWIWRGEK
jgi:hypothetical protein